MKIYSRDMLNSILESLSRIDYIHADDIPNIDLYMDQVTTFMDTQLSSTRRYDQDKILTKTMINNYAKNNLLPPPVKKKYTKEHVLILIFIYYFKNILSIKDIECLLHPLTEKYFHKEDDFDLTSIYEEVCSMEKSDVEPLMEEMKEIWANFKGEPQALGLPMAPRQFFHYFEEPDRPQARLDRDLEKGMAISIGRLRPDTQYDYKFVCLSHNTLRGAAGGAVELAELLCAKGYMDRK